MCLCPSRAERVITTSGHLFSSRAAPVFMSTCTCVHVELNLCSPPNRRRFSSSSRTPSRIRSRRLSRASCASSPSRSSKRSYTDPLLSKGVPPHSHLSRTHLRSLTSAHRGAYHAMASVEFITGIPSLPMISHDAIRPALASEPHRSAGELQGCHRTSSKAIACHLVGSCDIECPRRATLRRK